jgi:hypothetical protein
MPYFVYNRTVKATELRPGDLFEHDCPSNGRRVVRVAFNHGVEFDPPFDISCNLTLDDPNVGRIACGLPKNDLVHTLAKAEGTLYAQPTCDEETFQHFQGLAKLQAKIKEDTE